MLVEFRIANFRSFRDEQVLSLVASNDKTLRGNYATKGKLRLLKGVGIYGPNASGKSNLIKAIYVMKDVVLRSASTSPGEILPIEPFLLDDKSRNKPSLFEVTFYERHIRYQYGFIATSKYIQDEWLFAYPKGRAQLWYERSFNRKTRKPVLKFGTSLKGDKAKLAKMTRSESLFLSVGAQWNNEQLMNIYGWFKNKLRIVPPKELFRPITAKILLELKAKPKKKEKLFESFVEILKSADLGICGLDVKKIEIDEIKFKGIPEQNKKELIERLKKEPPIQVEMHHRSGKTGRIVPLMLEDESDGTQRFFQLLGPWTETLIYGFTVFIDELESSLHPLLTRELVEPILEPQTNKHGAQLIFATHDTTLLDPDLFRRDQIWFTEKDTSGATNLYSMSDYKERRPRKGEAMQKGYLSGRYGAIPILEAFSLK